ncbi:hypothetical protein ACH5RR_012422 [Cinchona calisaya]|uniref:Uncharacterized protein n=1 Tax=Cinchona calisaya TaxID=153742 RepID=A0ABD3A7P5_9GENT
MHYLMTQINNSVNDESYQSGTDDEDEHSNHFTEYSGEEETDAKGDATLVDCIYTASIKLVNLTIVDRMWKYCLSGIQSSKPLIVLPLNGYTMTLALGMLGWGKISLEISRGKLIHAIPSYVPKADLSKHENVQGEEKCTMARHDNA